MARSITEKIDPTRIYRPAQETTNLSDTTTTKDLIRKLLFHFSQKIMTV